MRELVKIKLGGREFSLSPTFEVWDQFEEQTEVGLLQHLESLYKGQALANTRARLVLLGLQAADPEKTWSLERVKKAMFESGAWHEDLVAKEAELIQKLLYTPEQFEAKKRESEEAAKRQQEIERRLAAFSDPSSVSL